MSTHKLHRIALPVTDIDAAEKFYSHVLQNPGKRISPDRHYYDLGSIILACYMPPGDQDWSYNDNQYIYFSAPDLDEMRQRVEEGGGQCLTENAEMPWGETMFFATDPSGSRLGIAQEDKLFEI